jgi:Fe-S cluster assembly iron-binding protein IscA
MLTITAAAEENITALLDSHQMPEGSGLRIAAVTKQTQPALELTVAPQPSAGDTVLQRGEVTLFLEPMAAQALNEMVLDVQRLDNEEGQQEYRFTLTPQSGTSPDGAPSA